MQLRFAVPVPEMAPLRAPGPPAEAAAPPPYCCGAMTAERVHGVLRRMSDADWAGFKAFLLGNLTEAAASGDLDLLERILRKDERPAGPSGGAVCRLVQAITASPPAMDQVRRANERMRERVRFVLREMSDDQWTQFKAALLRRILPPGRAGEVRVLELALRIGESVSNIETAASALAERLSGRRLIEPEIARRNALARSQARGAARLDPEAAYADAMKAVIHAADMANRAENTLACRYVEASAPFKHARNTLFRMVDFILEDPGLMQEVLRLEAWLRGIEPVSQAQMRWALHRMPIEDRTKAIKLIPLNVILMFSRQTASAGHPDLNLRATRDRRLAYECFVRGRNDHELAADYGLSVSAVKTVLGVLLRALCEKPVACRLAGHYLQRMAALPPMDPVEARRRLKLLSPERRASLLNAIPGSAWRARAVCHLHRHFFLDYLSGEWVLGALVDYYNLEKGARLAGKFRFEGNLTARGANAAMSGMLRKITQEPELRDRLRAWTSGQPASPAPETAAEEPSLEALMPPEPDGPIPVFATGA